MKEKAAVISLYHNSQNYGGVLQAYALNYVLNSIGIEAYQIDFKQNKKSSSGTVGVVSSYLKEHSLYQLIRKSFCSVHKTIYAKIQKEALKKCFHERQLVFRDFRENYIAHTKECDIENIGDVCADFDYYVCGSDQIWKPTVVNDAYMLQFVPTGKKRISYAASMSVDSITEDEGAKYSHWLKSFDAISVREFQAKKLLSSISEKQISWVCDPTLLLTKDQWSLFASKGKRISDKYIFCYFLGDDKIFRTIAKKYANENGFKIVTFPNLQQKPNKSDSNFGDYQFYDASPVDFVSLINGAECVFTDSFHATAFSLNMETPFYVFNRSSVANMNSRIYSILEISRSVNQFISNCDGVNKLSRPVINWKNVREGLDKHREESMNFLLQSLSYERKESYGES